MTSFPVDSRIDGCWKNYRTKILAWTFRLIKKFEIYTYRVHVTSSTKHPTFQFLNWKISENKREWDIKNQLKTNSSMKITMSTTVFCHRKLCDISAQEFWGPNSSFKKDTVNSSCGWNSIRRFNTQLARGQSAVFVVIHYLANFYSKLVGRLEAVLRFTYLSFLLKQNDEENKKLLPVVKLYSNDEILGRPNLNHHSAHVKQ